MTLCLFSREDFQGWYFCQYLVLSMYDTYDFHHKINSRIGKDNRDDLELSSP